MQDELEKPTPETIPEEVIDEELEKALDLALGGEPKEETIPEVGEPAGVKETLDEEIPSYPKRVDGQSEAAYQKRIEIWHLNNAKQSTTDPIEVSFIKEKIKDTKNDLREISYQDKLIEKDLPSETPKIEEAKTDEEIALALKKMGFVSLEDVKKIQEQAAKEAMITPIIEQSKNTVTTELRNFYAKNMEIYGKPEVRAIFEGYLDETFNISTKISSGKQLGQSDMRDYIKFAHSNIFGDVKQTNSKETVEKANLAGVSATGADFDITKLSYKPVGASEKELKEWYESGLIE
jgi:ribosomal protein S8